jgi:hypothetical protein
LWVQITLDLFWNFCKPLQWSDLPLFFIKWRQKKKTFWIILLEINY